MNADLEVDSIYRFYENGKLKTKILTDSNQLKENLVRIYLEIIPVNVRSNKS
jgi:hypothetical protein